MKTKLIALLSFIAASTMSMAQSAQEITIKGGNGLLSAVCTKPSGFVEGQKCPLVVFFHNAGADKEDANLKEIASALEAQGVATIRFDFSGHGQNTKDFGSRDMTLKSLGKDAAAIVDYAKALPYVKEIGFVGHGLGGVVALLAAEGYGKGTVDCLALLAPDLSLREDALSGHLYGEDFDPQDPPRKLKADALAKGFALDRDFIEGAQKTNILEAASKYKGETLVLIGRDDTAVPYSYGEYMQILMKNAKFERPKEIDHNFASKDAGKHSDAIARVVKFLVKELK